MAPPARAEAIPPADRKSGLAGMPRPTSYAVFCLKKKSGKICSHFTTSEDDLITLRNVLLELLNQIGGVVIRDSNDAQATRREIFFHGTQRRNFGTAGNAPGRPEIQQHHASAQIFQMQRATVQLSELPIRS